MSTFPKNEYANRLGTSTCKALEANGFQARYLESASTAVSALLETIPPTASVGIPGSVTLRELDLPTILEKRGNRVVHHWDPALSESDRPMRLQEEIQCDVFLTSSNAVTLDGMLVNIDGTGNRISGMAWGRGKLLIVVGINKICKDLTSALERARNVAASLNALRLEADTPCAKTGYCMHCNSPSRICRAVLILERAPFGRDSTVFIVGEPLGY